MNQTHEHTQTHAAQAGRHEPCTLINMSRRKYFNGLQMGVTPQCPVPFIYSEVETLWHEAAHAANS